MAARNGRGLDLDNIAGGYTLIYDLGSTFNEKLNYLKGSSLIGVGYGYLYKKGVLNGG